MYLLLHAPALAAGPFAESPDTPVGWGEMLLVIVLPLALAFIAWRLITDLRQAREGRR